MSDLWQHTCRKIGMVWTTWDDVRMECGMQRPVERAAYTHQKRPYRAKCLQWDGTNAAALDDVLQHLTEHGSELLIRHHGMIETLRVGDWVVTGENGEVKCYTDEVFRVKYEARR
jgi:hypothetical protein